MSALLSKLPLTAAHPLGVRKVCSKHHSCVPGCPGGRGSVGKQFIGSLPIFLLWETFSKLCAMTEVTTPPAALLEGTKAPSNAVAVLQSSSGTGKKNILFCLSDFGLFQSMNIEFLPELEVVLHHSWSNLFFLMHTDAGQLWVLSKHSASLVFFRHWIQQVAYSAG